MKYLSLCFLLFGNILKAWSNNDFIGWNEKSFRFIRCERTYDKSYVAARDAKYYNFIFKKPIKDYNMFQLILCLDNCENSTSTNSQEINCKHQNKDELLCPLIKGFLLDPLKKKGVLNITINVYGINKANQKHFLFKKVLELHHYILRGCMYYADIVKLNINTLKVKYDIKQLQYQLEGLPRRTEGRFDHFRVYVTLFSSLNKRSLAEKDLYLDLSNKKDLNQNDEYKFVPENSTCLSKFNQICINATWDFNPKNSTTRWQAVKHCTDFSYTQDFPKFSIRCNPNITNQLTISKNSDVKSIDPNIFHFSVDVKNKFGRTISVMNTTNLTITTTGPYDELSLCDECQCGKKFDNCEQLSPTPFQNSEIREKIIISVAVTIPVVLIIALGTYFYWRCHRKNDEDDPIQPNTNEDSYDCTYLEHAYYDTTTQSDKIVRVAVPYNKSNDTTQNGDELAINSYAYPDFTEDKFDKISIQNEKNVGENNENNVNQYNLLDVNSPINPDF